jgi:spore coat polysaccharide biosynthesis protein SpsF (cytidylyltransferase family)/sialic acid synthase SpsE/glycosyltransferase involved in cell wall biosynthesis
VNKSIKIIAEIANTHEGNINYITKLMKMVHGCKCDIIKYQIYSADELVVKKHSKYKHFKNQSFTTRDWDKIIFETLKHYDKDNIFIDVFGDIGVKIALKHDLGGIKIHSSDINNIKLIDNICNYKGEILLGVGGTNVKEIKYILNYINKHTTVVKNKVTIMHGYQSYPTKVDDTNLLRLKYFKELFPEYTYGISDHLSGDTLLSLVVPNVCQMENIKYVEKHVTIDRKLRGVDYYSSLSPKKLRTFVNLSKNINKAFGKQNSLLSEDELKYRNNVKKSWVARKSLSEKTKINLDDFQMCRVENSPNTLDIEKYIGKYLRVKISKGSKLSKLNFRKPKVLACIIARTESKRLKNKALRKICGEEAIIHLLKRLFIAKKNRYINTIVLCTTNHKSDDKLSKLFESHKIKVIRGDSENVLSRLITATNIYSNHEIALRITGDDILVDPEYINKTINTHLEQNNEYTDAKCLPSGTEVEVFDCETLKFIYKYANDSTATEYLTYYITRNKGLFKIGGLTLYDNQCYSDIRLTIDTEQDFKRVKNILEYFKKANNLYSYTIEDILKYTNNIEKNTPKNCVTKGLNINDSLNLKQFCHTCKVTVYITNYNYGQYLDAAIQSVLNQTLKDIELIIIDDGSKDNSISVIEKYYNHPNIKVILQKNKGLNKSNNVALREATGKYIIRLDADDILQLNALEIMSSILDNDDKIQLLFPDYYTINQKGKILSCEMRNDFTKEVKVFDQPAHGACTMIRTKTLTSIKGYSELFKCQDGYELWLKITKKYCVDNVNLPLFYYRQHEENLTKNIDNILWTRSKIVQKYTDKHKNFNVGIIPLRKKDTNLALKKVNGKYLISFTIDQALNCVNINKVILTTDCSTLIKKVKDIYKNKILYRERHKILSEANVPIKKVIDDVISNIKINKKIDIISILNYEYPFRKVYLIEQSINAINLFKVNSSLSVKKNNNNIYFNAGVGLTCFSKNTHLRKERDYFYEETGGVHSIKLSEMNKTNEIQCLPRTQIIFDDQSCFKITCSLDIKICQLILKQTTAK